MGNWWKITRLEILLTMKDKQAIIWSLVAPIAFTAFIGYSLNKSSEPGPIQALYQNGNNPAYVEKLFKGFLEKNEIVLTSGDNLPVISPEDSIMSKILTGKGARVNIKVDDETKSSRLIAAKAQKILYTILFRARQEWLSNPPGDEELDSLFEETGTITLSTSRLGIAPRKPSGTERTLPSVIVMFLLFMLFTFYAVLWVEDSRTGKIVRITMSPSSMRDIFLSQVLSRFLWVSMQVIIVGIVATLIFRIKWELPVLATIVLLIAYMISITSLGMLFGSFFESHEKANALGVILSLVLAALGGCWWPLEIVSAPMKVIALFTPTGLAMDAFNDFLAYGKFSHFPAFNVFLLLLTAIVAMPVAIRRMRKQLIK